VSRWQNDVRAPHLYCSFFLSMSFDTQAKLGVQFSCGLYTHHGGRKSEDWGCANEPSDPSALGDLDGNYDVVDQFLYKVGRFSALINKPLYSNTGLMAELNWALTTKSGFVLKCADH
ncbi:MAG: hypothetical protein V4793_14140, partial [Paraburkholderia tropica]